MIDDTKMRIELEASHALANWKHIFSVNVRELANERAKNEKRELITLTDYHQAAKMALSELSNAIEMAETNHGQRQVA